METDSDVHHSSAPQGKNQGNSSSLLQKYQNGILLSLMLAGLILVILSNTQAISNVMLRNGLSDLSVGLFATAMTTYILEGVWGNHQRAEQKQHFENLTREQSAKFSELAQNLMNIEKQLDVFKKTGLTMCYSNREYALKNFLTIADAYLLQHRLEVDNKENEHYIEVVSSSAKGLIGSTLGDDYPINHQWRKLYIQYPNRFKYILTHPSLAHLRRSIEGRSNGHIEVEIFRSTLFLLVEAARSFLSQEETWKRCLQAPGGPQALNTLIAYLHAGPLPAGPRLLPVTPGERSAGFNGAHALVEQLKNDFARYAKIRFYRGSPTVFTVRVGDHILFNPYSYGTMAKDMLCLEFVRTPETNDINSFYAIHFQKTWQSGEYGDRLLDGRPLVERVSSICDVANALSGCLLLDSHLLRLREKQVASLDIYYRQLIEELDEGYEQELLQAFYKQTMPSEKKDDLLPADALVYFSLVRLLLEEYSLTEAGIVEMIPSSPDERPDGKPPKACQGDALRKGFLQRFLEARNIGFFPDPETVPTVIIPLKQFKDRHIEGDWEFDFEGEPVQPDPLPGAPTTPEEEPDRDEEPYKLNVNRRVVQIHLEEKTNDSAQPPNSQGGE
ncbi:MAG: hypothetical protein GYA17_16940 [Chloroflexi bacterium]|nr:hypothetical protein [Chloroflexota bacterium]